jgi:hypothetical protein
MANGRPIKGKASKVGTAVRGMPLTTDVNPLDDRADNVLLARRERGIKKVSPDTKVSNPARAVRGSKVRGSADLKGGTR